ncbi:MAG TPA: hypothetical protein VFD73_10750 [Gemmatimonadales bacterium]|nr:hypothetical protein [Gemmatimonadales bacterium]
MLPEPRVSHCGPVSPLLRSVVAVSSGLTTKAETHEKDGQSPGNAAATLAITAGTASAIPSHPAGHRFAWPGTVAYEVDNEPYGRWPAGPAAGGG